jgi:hypothetical protein
LRAFFFPGTPERSHREIAEPVRAHPSQVTPKRCPEYAKAAHGLRAQRRPAQRYISLYSGTALTDLQAYTDDDGHDDA